MMAKKKRSCSATVRNPIGMASAAWTKSVSILLHKRNVSIAGQDVKTNGVFMQLIAAATFVVNHS